MKLYCAHSSPYSRKARAAAVEAGVADRIELVLLNPWENPPALLEVNPLGRIPVLATDEGITLFGSAVVAEYLDSIGSGTLFPEPGPARWRALKRLASGDGMLESLVPVRLEFLRPEEHRSAMLDTRWRASAARMLAALESEVAAPGGTPDIGDIAVGCALGYLDFRFPDWDWRKDQPKLAAWYEALAARPSFTTTIPS